MAAVIGVPIERTLASRKYFLSFGSQDDGVLSPPPGHRSLSLTSHSCSVWNLSKQRSPLLSPPPVAGRRCLEARYHEMTLAFREFSATRV